MEVYRNVLNPQEAQKILNDLAKKYPQIYDQNCEIKIFDPEFEYLKMLPKIYFSHLTGSNNCSVLISTVDGKVRYTGDKWHIDGPENQTTVLMYLNGDPSGGGKFITKTEKTDFDIGTVFILPSNVLHRVAPYNSNTPRICLKWIFTR